MLLQNAIISSLTNLILLVVIPFFVYFAVQKKRRSLTLGEAARLTGMQLGEARYIAYSMAFALASVVTLVIWSPSVESSIKDGSAFQQFAGLGLGGPAIPMALLYGVIKTGFSEEFLFRGLIAGALSRRFSMHLANTLQALIFLLPHIVLIFISPEMWPLLIVIFFGSLFLGWVRIKSGSIIGPWIVHASANVFMCLHVAVLTAP